MPPQEGNGRASNKEPVPINEGRVYVSFIGMATFTHFHSFKTFALLCSTVGNSVCVCVCVCVCVRACVRVCRTSSA